MMEQKFDYAKAVKELEEIAAKVETPETKLDDIDALVGRSKELLKQCREYLRTVKEKIDSLRFEIENIVNYVNRDSYPRSETGWKLSATINDHPRTINLTSDEFWKCMEVVLDIKRDQLSKLRDEFAKL